MAHIEGMAKYKQRQKAAPPPKRPDLWFREVSAEKLRNDLVQIRESMGEGEVYHDVQMLLETMLLVRDEAGQEGVSLSRLKYLIFGPKTESFAAVCKEAMESQAGRPKEKGEKPKGHGRNGADDFPRAKRIPVALAGNASGEPCPHCPNGKVYPLNQPSPLLRIVGVAPIQATVYELERRRCNLCGQVFTASAPEGVGEAKYDVSVGALLALLRYGAGLPMNRLERLQLAFGIPMPVSTQWDLILKAADLLTPAYAELTRQAAQGEVLYNDDTVMRILEKAPLERKATYTSSILSRAGEHRIALFITGHRHAGENLGAVLSVLPAGLPDFVRGA